MWYFYDLSSLDVQNALTHCVHTLYKECVEGGAEVVMQNVYCVELDLTDYAAFHDGLHQYALLFFERVWNEELWEWKILDQSRDLKEVTTRVLLSTQATENPPHDQHLFTSEHRYIDFAKYQYEVYSSEIPETFIRDFNQRFVGYLMRSERSFDGVHEMLKTCQLEDVLPHDRAHRECDRYAAYSLCA